MSDMPRRKRRKFTAEQKADAVRMVRKVGNLAKVARDLDLTETSLRNWVVQAEFDDAGGTQGSLTTEGREDQLIRRPEDRTLDKYREFLKQAAAFFARDQGGRRR
jgi:transposase